MSWIGGLDHCISEGEGLGERLSVRLMTLLTEESALVTRESFKGATELPIGCPWYKETNLGTLWFVSFHMAFHVLNRNSRFAVSGRVEE
jgi:hypothetical protein